VAESLKRIVWHGDSLERIRSFPSDARQDAGFEFERVQRNLEPRDWKPMNGAGAGVIGWASISRVIHDLNKRPIVNICGCDRLQVLLALDGDLASDQLPVLGV
jgi:hypothetical protein